jgi:hypothetical protein
MRKLVVGALVAALALVGAVGAWAVSSAQTTHDVKFRTGNKREGTPARPRANSLSLRLDQGTTTGSGQPATTTTINVGIPRQRRLNSERWPRRRRCNIATVNQRGTDSVCPRGSRIGRGRTRLLAADGGIEEFANIRAYVIRNGDLGFFIDSDPGEETEINTMVQGVTSRGRISIKIPKTLQEPVPGVKSAIAWLTTTIRGSAPIRGRTRGILETTGCRRGNWAFTLESRYDDGGRNRDTGRVTC